MYDDEARLIELLGQRFPAWRNLGDDPFAVAKALQLRLPAAPKGDTIEDEDEPVVDLDQYEGYEYEDYDDDQ